MSWSWYSFAVFERKIMQERRYFHDPEVQRFLSGLLATVHERVQNVCAGQKYWRAQLGCGEDAVSEDVIPFVPERMMPLSEKVCEGRVNPKGIPCLYLSKEQKTAICEVRPWVGSYITVAQFETLRDLKLADCHSDIDPIEREKHLDELFKLKKPDPEETTLTVWRHLSLGFSKPVDRSDDCASYVPTQVVAELFKANGFDGIAYRSVFNGGSNVALFNLGSARQVDEGRVVQLTEIDVAFREKLPSQLRWQKHAFEKR